MAKLKTPMGWVSLLHTSYKGMTHLKVDTIISVDDNSCGLGSIVHTNDSKSYPVAGSACDVIDLVDKAIKRETKEFSKLIDEAYKSGNDE